MRDNNFDIQENMQLFKTVYDDQEVCSLVMQTNAKNYIMNGGDLTDGKGIIIVDSICQNDKSNYKDDNI